MVLDQLGHGPDSVIPEFVEIPLEVGAAAAAIMSMITMAKHAVEAALRAKLKHKLNGNPSGDSESVRRRWHAIHGEAGIGPSVELDPFGLYLGDGRPVIWLWLDVHGATAAENKSAFGTHVYFDNDHWKWHVIPRANVTRAVVEQMTKDGFDEDGRGVFYLAHRIELKPGLRVEALTADIEKSWQVGLKLQRQ